MPSTPEICKEHTAGACGRQTAHMSQQHPLFTEPQAACRSPEHPLRVKHPRLARPTSHGPSRACMLTRTGHSIFSYPDMNCHHPPTQDGPPYRSVNPQGPPQFLTPPTPLTSSTWAWVCCSLLLLVRFGGGAGGPPSPAGAAGGAVAAVADLRGRDGLRTKACSPWPRSQGSAHPPVPPSVPPFLLAGKKTTRCEPWPPSGPAGELLRDLEGGPLPLGPQFPCLSNEEDLTRHGPGWTRQR